MVTGKVSIEGLASGVDPTTFNTFVATSGGLTPSVVTPPVDPQSWDKVL